MHIFVACSMNDRHLYFWKLLTAGLFAMVLSSCGNPVIYSHEHTFAGDLWAYEDSVSYEFEVKDTASLYEINLNVIHSDAFSFENLYVQINSTYPDNTTKQDVLSLEFADESGIWMGKDEGDYLKAPIALQPRAHFNKTGKYRMVFHQFSRRDSLPGMHAMELELVKLRKK